MKHLPLIPLLLASVAPLAAAPSLTVSSVATVMTGLNAPRGLGFGPDGALYVAEAGSAFDTTSAPFVVVRGTNNYLGNTGSVSRLLGGSQSRVFTGLPTLRAGDEAGAGPTDIAFIGGDAYVTVGMGLDVADRTGPFTALGNVLRFAGGTGPGSVFSDVAAHEAANNPAGDDLHSNPFRILPNTAGSLAYVVDAGANAVLSINGSGVVSTVAAIPPLPSAAVPFPPFAINPQPVPTSIAVAPDGTLFVGELGGFPFTPDASRIHTIAPGGSTATLLTDGFTHIIDLALAADGTLFVLEHDSNGLGVAGDAGALYALDPGSSTWTLLLDTLSVPTGMTLGADGTLYISNHGHGDGIGEVLAVTVSPVPEPAAFAALAGLAAGLVALRRRRS